jgi:Zn-dependent M28 family amino/carboxypeptidase
VKNSMIGKLAVAALLLGACATAAPREADRAPAPSAAATAASTERGGLDAALESISGERLYEHIRVLASDEFEGRAPGTRGEELTVNYLTEQFRALGLQPGNPDGTYVQYVPLVGITTRGPATLRVRGRELPLRFPEDYVVNSRRFQPEVRVEESELVFVGYGVVAPEFDWDDFKDVDVRGKTVVMLINDPAVPHPNDPSRLDESVFRGDAMTYYGRWTYKYEIASERGAAAALIVHETRPAGYPFSVVQGSWGQENFETQRADGNRDRVAVEGWISREQAERIFSAAGQDFEELKRRAVRRDFRPVPLEGTISFDLRNTMRQVQSRNVIARLEGAHPERRDEHIIYTAHWDHLGRDTTLADNQVFNGALDNASGTASIIEIARAFTLLPSPPDRSILFLAVTAEEQGLLGAKHYATNPLYPLERTLANINLDMRMDVFGRTEDINVIGSGNTTLEDILAREAAAQGRRVSPDAEPEKGFFYRSDHFEFAKQGVPALYTKAGDDFVSDPDGSAAARRAEFTALHYHKPTDEVRDDWDFAGAVEDLQLLFMVGYRVAQAERWPEWKRGTEFRALREEMLRNAGR